jgi:hypothetical protein
MQKIPRIYERKTKNTRKQVNEVKREDKSEKEVVGIEDT